MYAPIVSWKTISAHIRFQTKMSKVFSDQIKRPKNPTLGVAHTYMAYVRKYLPGPDPFHD